MHSLSGATHILEGLLSLLQPLVGVLQLGGCGAELVLQLDHLLLQRLHLLLGLEKGLERLYAVLTFCRAFSFSSRRWLAFISFSCTRPPPRHNG